ncbi:F-box/FBD/LRR-repeat protein At1g13570-like [Tasmannia lanceolata]|uniref:F-box/FBD/LRR-repeat protein At1g13570-like n=1 Tax=Tasmannia lanceolata TaxID=3420 RepID=UPI004063FC93
MSCFPKRQVGLVSKLDLISNLPRDVIDTILVHLPIKDVVRTTILSRKWRYKWVRISQIVFNEQYNPPNFPLLKKALYHLKRVNIIDQVLLHHRAPIHMFECSDYLPACCPDINRWIRFLSRHRIKEFILEIPPTDCDTTDCDTTEFCDKHHYRLPLCLFSCHEMYHLRLKFIIWDIPRNFEGFCHLKVLDLENVFFTNQEPEFLISRSSLLESLTLITSEDHPSYLKINGPNLQYLELEGSFKVLSFENTPVLATASIYTDRVPTNLQRGETCIFTSVLDGLHNVEELEVNSPFLMVVASGDVPNRVSNTFNHLKKLSLPIDFIDPEDILAVLSLFRSSLNLQNLKIWSCTIGDASGTEPVANYWNAQRHMDCTLNHLQTVKISSISGVKPELEFIEMLLMNSPVLERLTIKFRKATSVESKVMIMKELMTFQRASAKAELWISYDLIFKGMLGMILMENSYSAWIWRSILWRISDCKKQKRTLSEEEEEQEMYRSITQRRMYKEVREVMPMPEIKLTLNSHFCKEGEYFPYYRFPEWSIHHITGEKVPRFQVLFATGWLGEEYDIWWRKQYNVRRL